MPSFLAMSCPHDVTFNESDDTKIATDWAVLKSDSTSYCVPMIQTVLGLEMVLQTNFIESAHKETEH